MVSKVWTQNLLGASSADLRRYRSLTPKARLIALSASFLSYLRADGIILPPEDESSNVDSEIEGEDEEEDEPTDPSEAWPDVHQKIKSTISELGGSVMPKLNWSAPKDATWISATNSMACTTPNDIYLLLKSSDFITHDLDQVFDDCEKENEDENESESANEDKEDSIDQSLLEIPYHLVLRKTIPAFNPALEIRCFVRSRSLLCMCQRDLNHFDFLPRLIPKLRSLIQDSFDKNLKRSFPDESFVFDVYIPPPHDRVWLIDVNPWAQRTDPLLFSWMEILSMRGEEHSSADKLEEGAVRLSLNGDVSDGLDIKNEQDEEEEEETEDEEEDIFTPEFRLVNRDDPEAYNFNTPQYSAHKLPKDVVDASADGEAGLREFMGTWREIVARQEKEDREEKRSGLVDEN